MPEAFGAGAYGSVTQGPAAVKSLQVMTTPVPAGAPEALPARTRLPGGPKPAEDWGWIQIVRAVTFELKVAVQERAADMTTLPSAQSAWPLHPANVEPEAAAAVRVTDVPET